MTISSWQWKTLVSFWLRKKKPDKAFLTMIVNYRKTNYTIQTTIIWLFNDIGCYY